MRLKRTLGNGPGRGTSIGSYKVLVISSDVLPGSEYPDRRQWVDAGELSRSRRTCRFDRGLNRRV